MSSDFFDRNFPVNRLEQIPVTSGDFNTAFAPDCALVVLGNEVTEVFHGVEDDFLFVGSFCYHAYTIPQNREKARDFFCDCENIFYFFA